MPSIHHLASNISYSVAPLLTAELIWALITLIGGMLMREGEEAAWDAAHSAAFIQDSIPAGPRRWQTTGRPARSATSGPTAAAETGGWGERDGHGDRTRDREGWRVRQRDKNGGKTKKKKGGGSDGECEEYGKER